MNTEQLLTHTLSGLEIRCPDLDANPVSELRATLAGQCAQLVRQLIAECKRQRVNLDQTIGALPALLDIQTGRYHLPFDWRTAEITQAIATLVTLDRLVNALDKEGVNGSTLLLLNDYHVKRHGHENLRASFGLGRDIPSINASRNAQKSHAKHYQLREEVTREWEDNSDKFGQKKARLARASEIKASNAGVLIGRKTIAEVWLSERGLSDWRKQNPRTPPSASSEGLSGSSEGIAVVV